MTSSMHNSSRKGSRQPRRYRSRSDYHPQRSNHPMAQATKSQSLVPLSNAEGASDQMIIDVARAEIILNMFDWSDLETEEALGGFVDALFTASNGNQTVLGMLVEAPFDWPDLDAGSLGLKLRELWKKSELKCLVLGDISALRDICARQSWPWPASMMKALFDDPAFDAASYLHRHNQS